MRFIIPLFAAALASCQAVDTQAARDQRLQQYVGLTVAEFITRTGLAPSSATPTAGGRVFLVEGPTVVMSTPAGYGAFGTPGVAQSFTCRIVLDTSRIGHVGAPGDWRIEGVTTRGPCDNAL